MGRRHSSLAGWVAIAARNTYPGAAEPVLPPLENMRLVLAPALLVLASACSSSTFRDYPDTAMAGVRAWEQGRFDAAAKQFGRIQELDEDDAFLAYAETGMVWHVANQPERAVQAWLLADKKLKSFDDRPTISGRSITEGLESMMLNDKAIPYDGEDFEVALLHGLMAWDYLRMGSLDDAMVEVLRGYHIEEVAEERYDTQYGMNRFARFVAAIVQEVDANFDEAELDLSILAQDIPGHPSVDYSLERVKRLQSADGAVERELAQLIVVHEVSRMPGKIAVEHRYHTGRSSGRISVPKFGYPPPAFLGVQVSVDQDHVGNTVLLENVLHVARANLDDRMAWTLAKSVGRAAAKTILIDKAAKNVKKTRGDGMGFLVSVVGSLLQFATERADLRSWISLPQSIEVLRVPVAAGEHEISLQIPGGENVMLGKHSFKPGKPVLITVRTLRQRVYTQIGPTAASDTIQP